MTTAKIVELETYQKKHFVIEVSQNLFLPCKIHEGKNREKKTMSLMDWKKHNFTYITYKLAKSNLGNLCLQFKSAPFISMLSPTYKLYMSSKFQKLFASPIRKKQSPSS